MENIELEMEVDANDKTETKSTEVCKDLKNIKYKTMLLHGVPLPETKASDDLSNLDKFLEEEKLTNGNEHWCKLNKTSKMKKLMDYVIIYSKENHLDTEETTLLISFLKDSMDKKKLSRVKDVIYDKTTGTIKQIPALTYAKATKRFTLKNLDKRVSTLKSLAPKKGHGTIRHKTVDKEDTDDETS